MTKLSLAGIAGLGVLLSTTTFTPAVASQSLRAATMTRRPIAQPAVRAHRSLTNRNAASTCNNTAADTFTGISDASDYAGNYWSTVPGGEFNEACDEFDAVLGGEYNTIGNNGDAPNSSVTGGYENQIDTSYAFIGGGYGNRGDGAYSAIGGGYTNTASGEYAFAGAGLNLVASGAAAFNGAGAANNAAGGDSFVGAGEGNSNIGNGSFLGAGGYSYITGQGNTGKTANSVSGTDSFLGAGDLNTVAGDEAFVGGGGNNMIGSGGAYAVIVGGDSNEATNRYASVFGGFGNNAGGQYATILGGDQSEALGTLSLAAGYHAHATHNGSFVWADYSSSTAVADTTTNQFIARAANGFTFYTNAAATSGVRLAAGGGSWSSLSDRNSKTAIVPLDDDSVLSKVASLPVSSWQYKSERGVTHVGPMAQDFYKAFGVGEDDRHITTIDEDGVAIAAIKALNTQNETLRSRLATVEAQNAAIEHRLDVLASKTKN